MHPKYLVVPLILLVLLTGSFLILEKKTNVGKVTEIPTAITNIPQNTQKEQQNTPPRAQGSQTYIYGLKLVAKKSTDITYYYQDTIGTNTMTTSQSGTIASKEKTYSYGKTLAEESLSGKDQFYIFTGKEDDGKLTYFGARYLDVRTGRFVSTDPLVRELSPYAYADDNPLAKTDPTGMATVPNDFVGPLQEGDDRSIAPTMSDPLKYRFELDTPPPQPRFQFNMKAGTGQEGSQLQKSLGQGLTAYKRNRGKVDSAFEKSPIALGVASAAALGIISLYSDDLDSAAEDITDYAEKKVASGFNKIPGVSDAELNLPAGNLRVRVLRQPLLLESSKKSVSMPLEHTPFRLEASLHTVFASPPKMKMSDQGVKSPITLPKGNSQTEIRLGLNYRFP